MRWRHRLRVLKRFPYLERELGRLPTHRVARLPSRGSLRRIRLIDSDEPAALMIRRVEFDDCWCRWRCRPARSWSPRRRLSRLPRPTPRSTSWRAMDGTSRRPRDRCRRRAQRRRTAAWDQCGLAGLVHRSRHDGGDLTRGAARSRSVHFVGGVRPDPRARAGRRVTRRLRSAPEGYAYIFPKRDHVNVGIGYVLAHYRDSIGTAPYELQRGLVDHLRAPGGDRRESVRGNFTPLHPGRGPLRRPGRGRVLLAGDAGGFVNAFTAEGIYYAMVSGELAAKSYSERQRAPCPPSPSATGGRATREIGAELQDSVLIQRYLFGGPAQNHAGRSRVRIVRLPRHASSWTSSGDESATGSCVAGS